MVKALREKTLERDQDGRKECGRKSREQRRRGESGASEELGTEAGGKHTAGIFLELRVTAELLLLGSLRIPGFEAERQDLSL